MRATSRGAFVTAIVAVVAVLAMIAPANAAVTGAGTVVGTVTINGSGIPTVTQPKALTTYKFGAVNITGIFKASAGQFIGTVAIPAGVTGGTTAPGENTLGGKGYVNSFTATGKGVVGKFSAVCSGKFTRNVSIVQVNLTCNATISGKPAGVAKVTVVANFTPTTGNGVTTRVKAANFAGVYRSA
jgi:hypothetical protein